MNTTEDIILTLKEQGKQALKAGDSKKRADISTVIADLMVDGKAPVESNLDKAFATLKSYRKSLVGGGDMKAYIDILEALLPSQMTQEQLQEVVDAQGLTDMKSAMVWFKKPENKHFLFEPSVLKRCFGYRSL